MDNIKISKSFSLLLASDWILRPRFPVFFFFFPMREQ